MSKLCAFNSAACAFVNNPDVVDDATAGRFNSAYVGSGMLLSSTARTLQTPAFVNATSATDIWVAFTIFPLSLNFGTRWITFLNSSGQTIAYLHVENTNRVTFNSWNGTTFVTTELVNFPRASTLLARYDIHLVCGAAGSLDIYHYNRPAFPTLTGVFHAAMDNVAAVVFQSAAGTAWYSEIMVAQEDTRDHHLRPAFANANGANTAFTGVYTDINELVTNDTTVISSNTAGQKESYTKASYALPNGLKVNSVWVGGRCRYSGPGVTDGKFNLRIGGADYASSLIGPVTAFEPRIRTWSANPATSGAWDQVAVDGLEFGVEAT